MNMFGFVLSVVLCFGLLVGAKVFEIDPVLLVSSTTYVMIMQKYFTE